MSRFYALLLLVLLFAGFSARAQVSIDLALDQDTYMQYETIKLSVTVENMAGAALDFGTQENPQGYMRINVTDGKGQVVMPRWSDMNPMVDVVLPAAGRKSRIVPLNLYFPIEGLGTYDVNVVIGHNRMSHDFRSRSVRFTIRQGTTLWEANLGMPDAKTGNIHTVKASVLNMRTKEGHMCFYRVEDDYNMLTTLRLSTLAAGSPPQFAVDSRNQVHILIASRPRLFTYYVFDLNGKMRDMRNYSGEEAVPYLQRDPDIGRVVVLNGRIAQMDTEGSSLEETGLPVMEMK